MASSRLFPKPGVKKNDAESKDSSDFQPNVNSMVDSGCDVVIGVGFNLADAIGAAAVANPDTNFALVDSTFGDYAGDNTRALVFNTQEAAYLAGYAAVAMTKTGTVATRWYADSFRKSSWMVSWTVLPSTTRTITLTSRFLDGTRKLRLVSSSKSPR